MPRDVQGLTTDLTDGTDTNLTVTPGCRFQSFVITASGEIVYRGKDSRAEIAEAPEKARKRLPFIQGQSLGAETSTIQEMTVTADSSGGAAPTLRLALMGNKQKPAVPYEV